MQAHSNDMNAQQVLSTLDSALAQGRFSASYNAWATRLRDRLRNPVQVIIIGRPGAGKSALIDEILGQNVVRDMAGPPELHVVQGTSVRCYVEYFDGRSEWREGLLSEQQFSNPVARACQELPDPALAERNLIEIGLPGDLDGASHVLAQAAASADILIWCSPDFATADRHLLSKVPDRLRDHGFLVLTKTDLLHADGVLKTRIASVTATVAEDFLGLYPVSLGASRLSPDSGATLRRAIDRQIALGRAADLDQARMILRQAETLPQPAQAKQQQVRKAKPSPAPDPTDAAARLLRDAGRELLAQIDDAGGPLDARLVIAHCNRTLDSLSALLSRDRLDHDARDLVEEGQEMLLLIQLEKGDVAAQDAVTLLLQLRRELSELEKA